MKWEYCHLEKYNGKWYITSPDGEDAYGMGFNTQREANERLYDLIYGTQDVDE